VQRPASQESLCLTHHVYACFSLQVREPEICQQARKQYIVAETLPSQRIGRSAMMIVVRVDALEGLHSLFHLCKGELAPTLSSSAIVFSYSVALIHFE
jgi:hypothetical protein